MNLEQRRDREVAQSPSIRAEFIHSDHINRSHSRSGSQILCEQETRNLRLEVDHLRRWLQHRVHFRENRTHSLSQSYRRRSRTPPSESFRISSHLVGGERHHWRRVRNSPPENMENDAMSRALHQIPWSPFSSHIERAELPYHFTQPTFTIYNGRTDPVEHVSHFNQRMTIYSRNKALMCKLFPSSLRPIAMRWFNGLEEGSIGSYEKLTRAFGAKFVTCSRILRPLDSLLSLAMREE